MRNEFVEFAKLLPRPNILVAETNKIVLPATKPQKSKEISLGTSLDQSEPLKVDDQIIRGLIDINLEMRALNLISARINRNQPKTLRKGKDDVGMSRGEKVLIAKAMISQQIESGMTLVLLIS
jgi:hypothetical protein